MLQKFLGVLKDPTNNTCLDHCYSADTYSVDWFNLEYPHNRWSHSYEVSALSLEWKDFEEILTEVSLQNKYLLYTVG